MDEEVDSINLSIDEIIALAYALEYEYNDEVHGLIGRILEKIEQGLHIDAYVGSRLAEYGRIMGWSKE
ncbi:MAG: hypothetical protein GF411_20485 [Candidatus Lokiarchaeota archaeon]|nr:hypothetical protein [Candidatus Lokiarchaeota archaeon]